MNNPYKVLGISEDATQEEIRAAYLNLVKKYHPDRYVDNPLKDLANEKLAEINQAYEILTKKASNRTYDREENNSYQSGYSGEYAAQFMRAREWITKGNLQQARLVLDAIPLRNALWYYLYGMIYYRQGWFDQARDYFTRAHNMEPDNPEYKTAYQTIMSTGNSYSRYQGGGGTGCTGCDVCTSLLCADCCCECMGGDLIRCC